MGALLGAIEDIPPAEMTAPRTIGAWSIKDVLSHITVWEEEGAKAFEIWKVGVEPDWSHITDLDEFNDTTVKQHRKLSLTRVLEQLRLIHNGVLGNIKSVPDAEYVSRGGVPSWLVELVSTHIDEHAARIIAFKNTLLASGKN